MTMVSGSRKQTCPLRSSPVFDRGNIYRSSSGDNIEQHASRGRSVQKIGLDSSSAGAQVESPKCAPLNTTTNTQSFNVKRSMLSITVWVGGSWRVQVSWRDLFAVACSPRMRVSEDWVLYRVDELVPFGVRAAGPPGRRQQPCVT